MRILSLTATLFAIGTAMALVPPAKADGFDPSAVIQADGWRHHHGRDWGPPRGHWRRDHYPPPRAYYAPRPRYYQPPPRYYYPPPRVYYPPPPRYYAPQPGVGVYLRF